MGVPLSAAIAAAVTLDHLATSVPELMREVAQDVTPADAARLVSIANHFQQGITNVLAGYPAKEIA